MTRSRLQKLIDALIMLRDSASDELALESIGAYADWKADTVYAVGDRRVYDEGLYRCEQAHTSQANWTPDAVPALWTMVSVEEFPEWRQPTGAQDAYRIGDKVSHNDKHWICTLDYNTYEPGVYGWEEV